LSYADELLAQPDVSGARREAWIPGELLAQRRHLERQLEQADLGGLAHAVAEAPRKNGEQRRAAQKKRSGREALGRRDDSPQVPLACKVLVGDGDVARVGDVEREVRLL